MNVNMDNFTFKFVIIIKNFNKVYLVFNIHFLVIYSLYYQKNILKLLLLLLFMIMKSVICFMLHIFLDCAVLLYLIYYTKF